MSVWDDLEEPTQAATMMLRGQVSGSGMSTGQGSGFGLGVTSPNSRKPRAGLMMLNPGGNGYTSMHNPYRQKAFDLPEDTEFQKAFDEENRQLDARVAAIKARAAADDIEHQQQLAASRAAHMRPDRPIHGGVDQIDYESGQPPRRVQDVDKLMRLQKTIGDMRHQQIVPFDNYVPMNKEINRMFGHRQGY